jgi:hypothetical protein
VVLGETRWSRRVYRTNAGRLGQCVPAKTPDQRAGAAVEGSVCGEGLHRRVREPRRSREDQLTSAHKLRSAAHGRQWLRASRPRFDSFMRLLGRRRGTTRSTATAYCGK